MLYSLRFQFFAKKQRLLYISRGAFDQSSRITRSGWLRYMCIFLQVIPHAFTGLSLSPNFIFPSCLPLSLLFASLRYPINPLKATIISLDSKIKYPHLPSSEKYHGHLSIDIKYLHRGLHSPCCQQMHGASYVYRRGIWLIHLLHPTFHPVIHSNRIISSE